MGIKINNEDSRGIDFGPATGKSQPGFGPQHVKAPTALTAGKEYIKHHSQAGFSRRFRVIAPPSEGNVKVSWKDRAGIEEMNLWDAGLISDSRGFWNQHNWIELVKPG